METRPNAVQAIIDDVVDAIDNNKDIQKVLDSNPRLNRLHSLLGFGEILRNTSPENKELLEQVIRKETQEERAKCGPYYDYYVALEVKVGGREITVKKGYDPYMADSTWYAETEPQEGVQGLRKPMYTLHVNMDDLTPMLNSLSYFLNRFAPINELILTPYLVHRATGFNLGQLVQVEKGSAKFVLLPENRYVDILANI